jgi:tetratricopeptide (TPR) repeat protein
MRFTQVFSVFTLAALVLAVVLIPAARADLELPRTSSGAKVEQTIGYTDMSISFSRPGVKDRMIWGGLVPYDEIWRTGANENTVFTTSTGVMVEDVMLPAGSYSVFTIPTEGIWTVIFNKKHDYWGSGDYDQAEDALRVQIKPQEAEFTEWMTFQFADLSTERGHLVLRWEKLALPIRLETNALDHGFAQAKEAMASVKDDDWRTPYRAASFVYDNEIDMQEGMKWAEMATKAKPHYLNESLYAKYLAHFNRYDEAVSHAEKAIELGKSGENPYDVRPTEILLAEWKLKIE